MSNVRLDAAIRQIEYARQYTSLLIADIDDSDWFVQPAGLATHVGWQVAHLAVAEYGLCLYRMRGRQPADAALLPSEFRRQFGKGSVPRAEPDANHSPAAIRDVLHRVHQRALEELASCTDEQLDAPTEAPFTAFPTKLGGLLFCAAHEMLHAGQLGILRRALGKLPLR
jgi:hypothetical protein